MVQFTEETFKCGLGLRKIFLKSWFKVFYGKQMVLSLQVYLIVILTTSQKSKMLTFGGIIEDQGIFLYESHWLRKESLEKWLNQMVTSWNSFGKIVNLEDYLSWG